jgi:hypothetical protein
MFDFLVSSVNLFLHVDVPPLSTHTTADTLNIRRNVDVSSFNVTY